MGDEVVKALDDVTFNIESGEMIAIVGKSGSGKSTLMHILGGLDKPDSGLVKVNSHDISKLSSKKLANYRNEKVGFIFQSFNLQSHLTALENVELPMIFSSKNRKDRRKLAMSALEKVGLKERMHHRPSELSGGQRQRVSIARALVNKPEIIFADEPTGNLDSVTGEMILTLLKELNKEEKVTIAIVTHDNHIAKSVGRVVQLKDGKLV